MKNHKKILLLSLATQAFAAQCTKYDVEIAASGNGDYDYSNILVVAHSPDYKVYELRQEPSDIMEAVATENILQAGFDDLFENEPQICGYAYLDLGGDEGEGFVVEDFGGSESWDTEEGQSSATLVVESESTSGCSCRNMVWTVVATTGDISEASGYNEVVGLRGKSVSTSSTTEFYHISDGYDAIDFYAFPDGQIIVGMDNDDWEPANLPIVTFTPTSAPLSLLWYFFNGWF